MPIYVYECSSCNTQFEVQQRITEDPLTTCVNCSETTIKKIIQPIAVVFKGSGFHINDYAPGGSEDKKSAAPSTLAPAAESKPAEATAAAPTTESAA